MAPPRSNRSSNVCHRIELPRRRWPARGRFVTGWPEGAPPLPTLEPLPPGDLRPLPGTSPRAPGADRPGVGPRNGSSPAPARERVQAPEAAPRTPARTGGGDTNAAEREIELLRRRLAKVSGLLESREDELRKLLAQGQLEPGLASVYTGVQGITGDSPADEKKREMMRAIFHANQALQERILGLQDRDGQLDAG